VHVPPLAAPHVASPQLLAAVQPFPHEVHLVLSAWVEVELVALSAVTILRETKIPVTNNNAAITPTNIHIFILFYLLEIQKSNSF
jgi:hypothetical protein